MEVLLMGKVILKRCCGNCEWSISPENEEEIMKENHYEEDDPTRPRAGDCCIGREHNGNYVCDSHEYISNCLQTYSFYEDKYLGPGYFIVTLYDDNVIKFLKLYRTGTYGNYNYEIIAYEYDSIKQDLCNGISFEIRKSDNEVLHKAITIFANFLNDNVVWSTDKNDFMTANVYKYSTCLYFTGSKDSKIIDIKIDKNNDYRLYRLVEHLYRNMAVATMNKSNDEVYGKVRKITKKI